MIKKLEYVRVSIFATLAELKQSEAKKTRLENAGYTLINETPNVLTYKKLYTQGD